MSVASFAAAKNANLETEQSCGRFAEISLPRTTVRLVHAAMRAAQRLWPEQTAPELATRTDASTRAAEYWIAGERVPNAEAFLRLVMTSGAEGVEILVSVANSMRESDRAAWWTAMSRACQRIEAEQRRDAAIAQLASLQGPERMPRAASKRRVAWK